MDLVDLILLLVFAGFPLLQFVLERLGGKQPPPPPPPDFDLEERDPTLPPPVVRFPQTPTATLPERVEDRWWEGADAWDAESLEQLTSEEVVSEREANELIALQERAATRDLPEATRVHLPVVSLEALEIDRKAEHGRFHATVAPHTVEARPRTALRVALGNRSELKRAIILSELLGPPPSLRP